MSKWGCIMLIALGGCSLAPVAKPVSGGVISLDLCADQAVLSLVPRSRIAAVSPEVASDPVYALPRAVRIPRIRASIEDVLALRPAIVVRSYGGGVNMDRQLRTAGITVVQLGYAQSLTDVAPNLRKTAVALGEKARGETLANAYTTQMAALPAYDSAPRMVYMTPGNVTAGTDTFVGQMISAAGFRPYSDRSGWPNLPLEEMQVDPPAAVARGFFDSVRHKQDAWSMSRHPALAKVIANAPTVDLPGGWVACGNHLSMLAIHAIAEKRAAVQKNASDLPQ